jgi:hypothetical protein
MDEKKLSLQLILAPMPPHPRTPAPPHPCTPAQTSSGVSEHRERLIRENAHDAALDCATTKNPATSRHSNLALAGCLVFFLLFGIACSDDPMTPNSVQRVSTYQPAPLNANNPYDSIGYWHNAILMHALDPDNMQPSDTTDQTTFHAAARGLIVNLPGMNIDAWDDGVQFIDDNPTVDWSDYLMTLTSPYLSDKEEYYIHRIGYVLHHVSDSTEIKDSLFQIEYDIVNDTWPAHPDSSAGARIAISVAKHSFYWWLWVFDGSRQGAFNKTQTPPIAKVVAADAAAVVSTVIEQSARGQSLDWVVIAARSAGASAGAAILAYWDDLVAAGESFVNWVWNGLKSIGEAIWPF